MADRPAEDPQQHQQQPRTADDAKRLRIKKYPNRRYYDASRSRHVTLEEIYALIRNGYEIEVRDSKSDEDITAKVLAQIIIELDPPKLGVFPVSLLHRLLRSNEQIVNDFVQKYFNQALTSFLDSQRSFEQYMRQAMGMPGGPAVAPSVNDWAKMVWGPFTPAAWAPGAPRGAAPPPPPASASAATTSEPPRSAPVPSPVPSGNGGGAEKNHVDELRDVVGDLRREIAELRARVKPGGPKKKRAAAAPRPRGSNARPARRTED